MKTIIIFSTMEDFSTTKVMQWLQYINPKIKVIRLCPKHFLDGKFSFNINDNHIQIAYNQCVIDINFCEIAVVWCRKWNNEIDLSTSDKNLINLVPQIKENLTAEFRAFFEYFLFLLERNKQIKWLNKHKFNTPNKLIQLNIAKQVDLQITDSFILNYIDGKIKISDFITKPITSCDVINYKKNYYLNYTQKVNFQEYNNELFLCYLQNKIDKTLELRIFYLDGKCYTLAIHSQNNSKTKIDYRNYDYKKPNRYEPFQIPNALQQKIKHFMQKMNLQTGSLDFIYTPDNQFVFLEVNPCGQYDIFNSCNIFPDKLIAEYLINNT
ncbi:MAG: hypothetical protein LBV69_09965 [Bacteroidales bacterium]|nr:hypothetical protein [Bacteroidales bacterium]